VSGHGTRIEILAAPDLYFICEQMAFARGEPVV